MGNGLYLVLKYQGMILAGHFSCAVASIVYDIIRVFDAASIHTVRVYSRTRYEVLA